MTDTKKDPWRATDASAQEIVNLSKYVLREFVEDIANGSSLLSDSGATDWGIALARMIIENIPPKTALPVPCCTGCVWDDAEWHDLYLTMETSGEPWMHFFFESEDNPDTLECLSDLASFIEKHNWTDPGRMAVAAERMILMERVMSA